ncbi:MAG: sigma-70 family RNA polymerase sigma factor [Rhodobacteraceae bacterium]|nr:sigma-70 family RNA polymerase sigma factor [Paracoccaceae bacterium]
MQKDKAYITFLAGRARLRDRAAFETLVQHFSPRLFAHAYRLLGHREEARDAVQEAWVDITRGLKSLRDDTAFMAWAYRITSRRCARQIDRNIKVRAHAPDMPEPVFEEASSVRAAIDRLKPVLAATIRLFYIEEMSLREVGLAMGVPQGTVKSRLAQARNELKSHLKGYEDDKY